MYHRILPKTVAEELNEEPAMYVTPETFNDHLVWLKEIMQPVKLSDWITGSKDSLEPGNYFAVTFDDGWQDNYQYAFPILKQHNIPATVFLVSSLMGSDKVFWPNRLASMISMLSDESLQTASIKQLREKLSLNENVDIYDISSIVARGKQYSDKEMTQWLDDAESDLPHFNTQRQLLNWQEISEMTETGLVDVGAHTKHHTRLLDTVSKPTIDDEVVGSKQEIESLSNQGVELFCYPNGDYCDYSSELVRKHFKAAVTTKYGINSTEQNIHKLNRVGLHQDISGNKTDFLARLACWR